MAYTYSGKLSVTLTVAQWSEIAAALADARRYNESHKWFALAEKVSDLASELQDTIGDVLDEASAQLDAEMAANNQDHLADA